MKTPKPILFNTDMVQAIQDSRKTVTRRAMKPQPQYAVMSSAGLLVSNDPINIEDGIFVTENGALTTWKRMPYCLGDILYVRETFHKDAGRYIYKADYSSQEKFYRCGREVRIKWSPSIHMPREAARIFLRVTDVRVERLQDITEDQAQKEGVFRGWKLTNTSAAALSARQAFMWIWDLTVKSADPLTYSWIMNPWVWVIEFERISKRQI